MCVVERGLARYQRDAGRHELLQQQVCLVPPVQQDQELQDPQVPLVQHLPFPARLVPPAQHPLFLAPPARPALALQVQQALQD